MKRKLPNLIKIRRKTLSKMSLRLYIILIGLIPLFACKSPTNTNLNTQNISNAISSPTKSPNPLPKNLEVDEKLQKQSDEFLPLFGNMPQVPVFIKDEPILRSGSETQKGVGYTLCESNNHPVIYLKKVFYQKANQKQLTNILKHELTHAYFCRQGIQAGHDERWRKKFREVGGFGN